MAPAPRDGVEERAHAHAHAAIATLAVRARIPQLPFPMTSPKSTVETERLTLRPYVVSDLDECAAMWAHPDVVRFIGGRPFTREESWGKLLRYAGLWSLLGWGWWAIFDRASGRFAGECGFADFKRQMTPSLDGAPECGWALAPWAHGKGIATEAVRGALQWMDTNVAPPRTVCIVDFGNTASIRVAEKCGFREQTRTTYKETPVILFERRT
jgi:RimJ/RimL family protein N-acetyltransferase